MDKVKITWLPKVSHRITQVYSSGLQFALVSPKLEQCHDFVFCKDFLQDAIWGWLNDKPVSICSFVYDKKKQPPISMDLMRLMVVNTADADFKDKVSNSLDLINQICKKLHLRQTELFEVENSGSYKTGAFLFVGSERWMNAPPMVSFFSLLIRAGCNHPRGNDCMDTLKKIAEGELPPYQHNDGTQVSHALKGMEKILEYGYRKWFYKDNLKNYPGTLDVGSIHGAGLCNMASGGTDSVVPHWTRKLKKKSTEGSTVAAS